MPQQLVADEMIEAAQRATGLQRFDSESFREGLDILLADANKIDYPESGIQRFRSSIIAAPTPATPRRAAMPGKAVRRR